MLAILFHYKNARNWNIFVICVHDTSLWVEIKDAFDFNLFICFSYIPHKNNISYSQDKIDSFDCLENDILLFSAVENVLFGSKLGYSDNVE
jgi:hypothetical protein